MATRVRAHADPAELVVAVRAGHVVAAFHLLNSCSAMGTKSYIFVGGPIFVLGIKRFFTRFPSTMVRITALEADFLSALTFYFFDVKIFSQSEFFTPNFWAPFFERVLINFSLLFEPFIFSNVIGRQNLLDVHLFVKLVFTA